MNDRYLVDVWVGPLSIDALKAGVPCRSFRLHEREDGTHELILTTSVVESRDAGARGVFNVHDAPDVCSVSAGVSPPAGTTSEGRRA